MMDITATNFTAPAPDAELETLGANLRARNFEVVIVQTGAEAKAEVLKRIPHGARIHSGKSKTLEDIGLFDTLMGSDEYDFVRKQTMKLDRITQRREMVRLGATPDLMINSVQAVTEAGQLVVVSASGSQIGPIPREGRGSSWSSAARRSCPTWTPHSSGSRSMSFRMRTLGFSKCWASIRRGR